MRVEMDITGIRRAIRDISAFDASTRVKVKDIINESALNIQKDAKQRCPVDTGRLRSSITIQPVGNGGMTLRIGTKVFYAPYVEWGTGKFANHPTKSGRGTPWVYPASKGGRETGEMVFTHGSKPHPFLFPAFEQEKPDFIRKIKEVLDK
jgi:HK97 gp10 family phage protein